MTYQWLLLVLGAVCILALLALHGCSDVIHKDEPPPPTAITYAYLRDNVFSPSCISCHHFNAAIPADLSAYEEVKKVGQKLCDRITSMPPGHPLAQSDPKLAEAVCTWVKNGLPFL